MDEKQENVQNQENEAIPVAVAAPIQNTAGGNPISTMKGAVIRQDTQELECCIQYIGFFCFEMDNVYRYTPLNKDQRALRNLNEQGWRPTMTELNNMPMTYTNEERSNMILKCVLSCCGCLSCRPFEMDFTSIKDPTLSYMHIDRKFTFGGFFCCPHNADVSVNGKVVGRVIEDWNCNNPFTYFLRCFEYCCLCRVPYDLQLIENGSYRNRYRINVNQCLCGPHCNFCGATIFCNDQLYDVAPYTSNGAVDTSNPSGRIQRTYGTACEPEACWRWLCCSADNYIVEWEESATLEERALYLTAATLLDYVFFETKDQNRNRNYIVFGNACGNC